jgi:ubiquinone/menaquinone biosynthesis C-methylase UbiE
MDSTSPDPSLLLDDLRNLRTINRNFGGLRVMRQYAGRLMSRIDNHKTIHLLDLATGSADHPVALVEFARAIGRSICITAVERNPVTLAVARERTAEYEEISIEEGDVLATNWEPASYDIVLCSLAIHHFSREDAVRILAAMRQIARVGLVVNDLNRTWPAAWIAWAYTHVTTRNAMTINDSYVSVLRAFTPNELATMAREAGIQNPLIRTHPFFRLVLVSEL